MDTFVEYNELKKKEKLVSKEVFCNYILKEYDICNPIKFNKRVISNYFDGYDYPYLELFKSVFILPNIINLYWKEKLNTEENRKVTLQFGRELDGKFEGIRLRPLNCGRDGYIVEILSFKGQLYYKRYKKLMTKDDMIYDVILETVSNPKSLGGLSFTINDLFRSY